MTLRYFFPLTLSTLLVISLCSCSIFSSSDSEPEDVPQEEQEAKEIKSSTVRLAETPENELFEKAKRLYQANSHLLAQEAFRSLKDGYPSGPYTEFAEIKIADCLFLGKQYEDSALAYNEVLKNRPNSSSIPYVLFQLARSNQMLNKGVGRDREPLERANVFFERLIEEHPDSLYSQTARHYLALSYKKLARHEEKVLDFYKEKGASEAYNARKKEFDKKWDPHIKKQLPNLHTPKSKIPRGIPNDEGVILAKENTTKDEALISKEKSITKTLVSSETEAQETQIAANETSSKNTQDTEPATLVNSEYQIRELGCSSRNGQQVTIFLNKDFTDEAFIDKNQYLIAKDSTLSLQLPMGFAKDITINCFSENDLQLSRTGLITIKTDSQATLLAVSNPARLLVFLD